MFSGYGNRCTTVLERRKRRIYCSQEKETGALILVHYCSQEKEIGALQFLGEGNCQLVLYSLLISGERNWYTNIFRKRELGALLFSGEEKCSSEFRRREKVLYCSQQKKTGALQTTVLKEKETGVLLLKGVLTYFWQIFGQQIILEGHYRNLRHHFFCVFSNSVFVYM